MRGFVSLVGAGPGDPGLLTVRGRAALEQADVVAYDELVSGEILALAPASSERVPVGRRVGQGPTTYRLHPAVLERARAGLRVVRLKSGDPFIFGRGGEEAEVLVEAGIPFEIVPGVSAALGAAASACIPLTHRLVASSVSLLAGYEVDVLERRDSETLVIYMGARRMKENLASLIERGHAPSTPVAYVQSATTPREVVIVGTLADIPERTAHLDPSQPALLIVGQVVSLRAGLLEGSRGAPRDSFTGRAGELASLRPSDPAAARPEPARTGDRKTSLSGRRIVVARARPAASELARRLEALGAEVIEAPTLEVAPLEDETALAAACARSRNDRRRGTAFACAASVEAVLRHGPIDASRAVAIGMDAVRALASRGLRPCLQLEGACREALERAGFYLGARPLTLFLGEEGRPNLVSLLVELGVELDAVPAYRVMHAFPDAPAKDVDLLVLPSSSAAERVLRSAWGRGLRSTPVIAMGPVTEAAARALGAERVHRAAVDSIDALVDATLSAAVSRPEPFMRPSPAVARVDAP